MAISWDTFVKCAEELLSISNIIGDAWTSRGDKSVVGGYYITKSLQRDYDVPRDSYETPNFSEDLEVSMYIEDKETIAQNNRGGAMEWDYHILYNVSYGVPVLYFNVCFSDGSLFQLEQLWLLLDDNFKGIFEHEKWYVLTQQEHPILRQPFFQLHPCKTAQFLEAFKGNSWNILITWLSSVGPLVGLQLPLHYSNRQYLQ